jgi:hypothetical protein
MLYWLMPNESFKQIESYKAFGSLAVSIFSVAASWFNNYNLATDIVFYYILGDMLFLHQYDMLLHHVLTLTFIMSNISMNLTDISFARAQQALVNVEISSIFLSLSFLQRRGFLPMLAGTEKTINVLFMLTFTKYRILDLMLELFWLDTMRVFQIQWPIYGLYIINLYWFRLLCIKAFNSIKIVEEQPIPLVINQRQRV